MAVGARREWFTRGGTMSRAAVAGLSVLLALGALAFVAPPASAATESIPLSTIPAAPPTRSGTLANGVTWTIDKGSYTGAVAGGWLFSVATNPMTWTFSEPVDVRFGIRNLQAANECAILPEGVVVESIDPLHDWDPATRVLCPAGATGNTTEELLAESIFTLANTTRLVFLRVENGSVERTTISFIEVTDFVVPARPAVVADSTNWSLSLGPNLPTIDFAYGARPLVPLMGDWDGDHVKTVGTFERGTFRLNNQNDSSAPELVFTFGNPRGYAVAGDFDGNGTDDVAVYFRGTWEIRYLGPNAPSDQTFTLTAPFGQGTYPFTIPVAGDWDGDGVDGIGTYDYATGTWVLKNTAGPGGPDIGPFVFWGGSGSYPVVGDWNGDGIDTPGYRVGTIWTVRTEAVTGGPVGTFDFGVANSVPFAW